MILLKKFICISIFIMLCTLNSNAADNCNKLKNITEKKIFESDYLKRLDSELNKNYNDLRKKFTKNEFESIKQEKIKWIKDRNLCKDNKSCIENSYTYIHELTLMTEVKLEK